MADFIYLASPITTLDGELLLVDAIATPSITTLELSEPVTKVTARALREAGFTCTVERIEEIGVTRYVWTR
jgi:energy-converting hydrogenase Eha subunit C